MCQSSAGKDASLDSSVLAVCCTKRSCHLTLLVRPRLKGEKENKKRREGEINQGIVGEKNKNQVSVDVRLFGVWFRRRR